MVRAPRLSSYSTPFDIINSVAQEAQMPIHSTGSTIADAMWLDSEPTSKSHLARCLAHLYEYQEERGAAPLPNFDEFLAALARPRWTWTPEASTLFRRIGRIVHDSRRSSPVQVTLREVLQRRRAAFRRRNGNRPIAIGREVSEATLSSTTEGSVFCCDERSEVS